MEAAVREMMYASAIRPALLQGLIPVDTPSFYDVLGVERKVSSYMFLLDQDIDPHDGIQHRNFQVIHKAVLTLKGRNCQYIYTIVRIDYMNGKTSYHVRGT